MAAIITRGTTQIPREETSTVDFNGAATADLPTYGLSFIQKISIVSDGTDAETVTVDETFANGMIACATKGIVKLVASDVTDNTVLVTLTGY